MSREAEYIRPRELAERIGICYITALTWIRIGKVKAVRIHSQYRVPISEVDRLLNESEVKPETKTETPHVEQSS